MGDKAKILVFNGFYEPGFKAGGPVKSLSNLVARLGDFFNFAVVARDRDLGDSLPYSSVKIDDWNERGNCQVYYSSKREAGVRGVAQRFSEVSPHVVYLNSFFDPVFTQPVLIARRLGLLGKTRVVVAPRGEFSKGAIGIKRVKKKLYILVARALGLYKGVHWHASSELEVEDILRELPWVDRGNVSVALNLAPVRETAGDGFSEKNRDGNELVVAFLSRIVPKKNLSFALRALLEVKAPVRFVVFGTREDEAYWNECVEIVDRLPANVIFEYRGFVRPDEVAANLAQADLFFFPTLGENYGHVIHEALCAGLPVILSDQTPWAAVAERKVGWVFPLDKTEPYVAAIESYWQLSLEERLAMARRAREYGDEVARNDSAVRDHVRMFSQVLPSSLQCESVTP